MKCDICLAPHSVLWGFTVAAFRAHADTNPGVWINHPAQEWAICDACRELLDARDLEGLLERTDKANLDRKKCEPFLSGMVLNISGPMVRCTSSDVPVYEQAEL